MGSQLDFTVGPPRFLTTTNSITAKERERGMMTMRRRTLTISSSNLLSKL